MKQYHSTAMGYVSSDRRSRPRPTQFTPHPRLVGQVPTFARRELRVGAQRTIEVAPREFARVEVTLVAAFSRHGDAAQQLAALSVAANAAVDWEIDQLQKAREERGGTAPIAFPAGTAARRVFLSLGGTFRADAHDRECFVFFRVEAGCEEPIEDGADVSPVYEGLRVLLGRQVRDQIAAQRQAYAQQKGRR